MGHAKKKSKARLIHDFIDIKYFFFLLARHCGSWKVDECYRNGCTPTSCCHTVISNTTGATTEVISKPCSISQNSCSHIRKRCFVPHLASCIFPFLVSGQEYVTLNWVINKKQTHIRHTSSSHNQMHMQTFNPYITSPPTEDTTVKPHTSICAYTSFHWSRYNVNRIKLVTNRVAYWPLTHGCFVFFKKPSHLMMIILILLIFK